MPKKDKEERIKSYEYKKWNDFDVDAELEKIEEGNGEDGAAEEEGATEVDEAVLLQAEILALKQESSILGQWSNPVSGSWKSQESSPWGLTAQSLICSIMDKPHTGLDECPRILLSCFRAWNSGCRRRRRKRSAATPSSRRGGTRRR